MIQLNSYLLNKGAKSVALSPERDSCSHLLSFASCGQIRATLEDAKDTLDPCYTQGLPTKAMQTIEQDYGHAYQYSIHQNLRL